MKKTKIEKLMDAEYINPENINDVRYKMLIQKINEIINILNEE